MYAGVPARTSSTASNRGEAEVHHAHFACAVEHHVGRLQIAMDDAALMRGGEARAQLSRDVGGFVFGESADPAERAREVFAVDVSPSRDRGGRRLRRCRRRGRRWGARPAARCAPRCETARGAPDRGGGVRQELQRDRLAEAQIVGPIDLAHAAAAEQTDDAVAAVEERARREAPVADRIRRGEPAAGCTRTGPRRQTRRVITWRVRGSLR